MNETGVRFGSVVFDWTMPPLVVVKSRESKKMQCKVVAQRMQATRCGIGEMKKRNVEACDKGLTCNGRG